MLVLAAVALGVLVPWGVYSGPERPSSRAHHGFTVDDLTSSAPIDVYVVFDHAPAARGEIAELRRGGSWDRARRAAAKAEVAAEQDRVLARVEEAGIEAQVLDTVVTGPDGAAFKRPARNFYLVNGVRMRVRGNQISRLETVPGVKDVFDDRPRLVFNLTKSTEYTQAPQVWEAPAPPGGFGSRGAGVVVTIIDTGVDWNHPMFGDGLHAPGTAPLPAGPGQGCFGGSPVPSCAVRNEKVIYAESINSGTPMDGVGHGTHVASTAAGSTLIGTDQPSPNGHIEGTAPDALIMSYKTLSDAGVGFTASSITAMEEASQDTDDHPKTDVINLSLGGFEPDNSVDAPSAIAADNSVRLGVTVVAAAGNCGSAGNALCPAGREGPGTTSAPATSRLAISVGASSDPGNAAVVEVPDETASFPAVVVASLTEENPFGSTIEAEWVNCGGANVPGDCGPEAEGKIGVIFVDEFVGPRTFEQAKDTAEAEGVVATIFVNDKGEGETGDEAFPGAMIQFDKPVLGLSFNSGEAIKGFGFDPGTRLGDDVLRMTLDVAGFEDFMAGFSSTGPLSDYTIKPDFTAPGQNIYAAHSFVCSLVCGTEGYASSSGTSMAAPHAAGLAAILLGGNPDWGPAEVKAALMNTAEIIGPSDTDPATKEVSITKEGSGRARVFDAARSPARLINPSFSFGEVVTPPGNIRVSLQRFRLTDVRPAAATGDLTYDLGVIPWLRLPHGDFKVSFRNPADVLGPDITQVTVPDGGAVDFMLRVEVGPSLPVSPQEDPDDEEDDFLVFEGYELYITADPVGFDAPGLHAPVYYRHVHEGSVKRKQAPELLDPGDESSNGTFELRWNPVDDGAAAYEIHESTNIFDLFPPDTAEGNAAPSDDEMWSEDGGWTSSEAENHTEGGTTSYFSGQGSDLENVLVSEEFSGATTLEFFELLDTEPDFDFASVRAVIGDEHRVLRSVSGNSDGWRGVKLDVPEGTTRIEFAYESDSNTDSLLFQGWFIDDIRLSSAEWNKIGESHGDTFAVSDRSNGAYFYRVAALREGVRPASHSGAAVLETGPFSNIENIDVVLAGAGGAAAGTSPPLAATGGSILVGVLAFFALAGSAGLVALLKRPVSTPR